MQFNQTSGNAETRAYGKEKIPEKLKIVEFPKCEPFDLKFREEYNVVHDKLRGLTCPIVNNFSSY